MGSNTPKISVIMPAYNTARLIAASLDSVLQQSFQDFEVLVVNDGSPDAAALEEVLAPYLERIVYIKQENKRAAGARNTAIRQARGEFLAFLDSDDTWLPDHLGSQMKLFTEDPTLGLVYSNCFAFADPTQTDEFMDRCPSHGPATFDALIAPWWPARARSSRPDCSMKAWCDATITTCGYELRSMEGRSVTAAKCKLA